MHSDLRTLHAAVSVYRLMNGGALPDDLEVLVEFEGRPHHVGGAPRLPLDPWGNGYRLTHAEGEHRVSTWGADEAPGGRGLRMDHVWCDTGCRCDG